MNPDPRVTAELHQAANFTFKWHQKASVPVLWIRIRIRTFSGLPDPDPLVRIRIRILLSSGKNSKKNLDPYCFVTSNDFLSLKNDVNVASKSKKQKKWFLVAIFKATNENSRFRNRIRIL
jgi:hypothetical protein